MFCISNQTLLLLLKFSRVYPVGDNIRIRVHNFPQFKNRNLLKQNEPDYFKKSIFFY